MANEQSIILDTKIGINKDSTNNASTQFIDGQWVRFLNNRPRKMGGIKAIATNPHIIRSLFAVENDSNVFLNCGIYNGFVFYLLNTDTDLNMSDVDVVFDRTPAGLNVNINNLWSCDLYSSSSYENSQILAHVAPNAQNCNNTKTGKIYYGNSVNSDALVAIHDSVLGYDIEVSGGIVCISDLIVAYGNNGTIYWNTPTSANPINDWHNSDNEPNFAVITNKKIIHGSPVSGSDLPSFLFWTSNSLLRVIYTLTDTGIASVSGFKVNVLENQTSLIAKNSVINVNQTFFWVGSNNFYMFDGVCREITNETNKQWFFDQLNKKHKNKIFAVNVPKYNEIHWFFPAGDSTECNKAIVLQISTGTWFSYELNRSAGISVSSLDNPIFTDNELTTFSTPSSVLIAYLLYLHEKGTDKDINGAISPIRSYFTHAYMDLAIKDNDRLIETLRIQPNFKMNGTMTVQVLNGMYPSDVEVGDLILSEEKEFNANTKYIDIMSQGIFVAIKFESNSIGSNYQMGNTRYTFKPGDKKP